MIEINLNQQGKRMTPAPKIKCTETKVPHTMPLLLFVVWEMTHLATPHTTGFLKLEYCPFLAGEVNKQHLPGKGQSALLCAFGYAQ